MAIYQKILFVGARGIYKNMPFEILGSGIVDYTTGGQTYPAVEYYCLANNGQTWYFAVNDEEVYYCKELAGDEIINLKNQAKLEQNQPLSQSLNSTQNFFNNHKIDIKESGIGRLNKADGRAQRDFRNFANFDYWDFTLAGRSYSLDIFPDGQEEWFETIWVSGGDLTKIFEDSLRLENKDAHNKLKLASLWKKISITSLIIAICLIIVGFGIESQKNQIFLSQKEISAKAGNEATFESFEIPKINQLYTLETEVILPQDYGVSLDFIFLDKDQKLITSSTQEFVKTDESQNRENFSSLFYPKEKISYKPTIKINDYGKIGEAQAINSCNQTEPAQREICEQTLVYPIIKITIKILEGGNNWPFWVLSGIMILAVSVFAWARNNLIEKELWSS